MAGLYIHIPFCKSRCLYCGFYSTTYSDLKQRYVDAVCEELAMRKNYITENRIDTIYLGGGTPSQLTSGELEQIFDYIYNKVYVVSDNAEVTMECNPDDITADFAKTIGALPINRISMGAQTFDDERLKFLHRRHNARQVVDAVSLCRNVGINNISIDLMYGFPEESIGSWNDDITKALSLDVEHISAYSLMFEEGTALYRMLEKKEVKEIDEELSLAMYEQLLARLADAGYEHYDISNFTKPSYRSRHNSSYWKEIPYIGIGAAAHSFNIKSRQWNVSDIRKYINAIENGNILMECEHLTTNQRYNDFILTSLRTCEGADLSKLDREYGSDYKKYCLEMSAVHINNDKKEIKDNCLRLTRKRLFASDDIMSDLMCVESKGSEM